VLGYLIQIVVSVNPCINSIKRLRIFSVNYPHLTGHQKNFDTKLYLIPIHHLKILNFLVLAIPWSPLLCSIGYYRYCSIRNRETCLDITM